MPTMDSHGNAGKRRGDLTSKVRKRTMSPDVKVDIETSQISTFSR